MNHRTISDLLAALLMVVGATSVTAQERLSIQLEAGAAVSYVSKQNSQAEFRPRVFPNAGITALVPVSRLGIRTGLLYQQKGWEDFGVAVDDTSDSRWELTSRMRMQTITLPLQLYYCTHGVQPLQYFFAGGISYGIVLSARQEEEVNIYHRGEFQGHQEVSHTPYLGVVAKDSTLKATYNQTMYYRFVPSLRVDAGVVWNERYFLRLFWERSINSISVSNNSAAALTLGYCGMTLGVDLSKLGKKKTAS